MIRRLLSVLWPPVLLVVCWQVWIATGDLNRIVVVSPGAVVRDLVMSPGVYLQPTAQTLGFAVAGLLCGMMAGMMLAVAAWWSAAVAGMVTPVALCLAATPVVCLLPIAVRIFGYSSRTELVVVGIMTLFPSFIYGAAGLRDLPAMAPRLFRVLDATRWQRLRLLALPAAAPSLMTGLRVGATYSVLVTLMAEYLMQTGGLGTLFAVTLQQFHMARALGASVVAMALSVALFEVTRWMELRVVARFQAGR